MSREPLVGVTTSITVGQSPERAYVNSAYLEAVQQAGGVPVLLPPQLSKSSLERLVRGLDAVLLTGGGDMDPACFGEAPHSTLYDVAPARDALETSVTHMALEKRTPLLAICRGIQVLNVALGGTLYQDVGTEPGTQIQHSQKAPRDHGLKPVAWAPDQLVEGVELDDDSRFVMGVQWHPEHLVRGFASARRLFASLIDAARR